MGGDVRAGRELEGGHVRAGIRNQPGGEWPEGRSGRRGARLGAAMRPGWAFALGAAAGLAAGLAPWLGGCGGDPDSAPPGDTVMVALPVERAAVCRGDCGRGRLAGVAERLPSASRFSGGELAGAYRDGAAGPLERGHNRRRGMDARGIRPVYRRGPYLFTLVVLMQTSPGA